jgi:acyl carrier protein phosphodiesterase
MKCHRGAPFLIGCHHITALQRRKNRMSSNTPLVNAAKLALKEEVNKAQPITMSSITLALSRWHWRQWVSVSFLLPDYMKNYWKNDCEEFF